MKHEVIIDNLIRSLESVRQFANGEAEFYDGAEFMQLHLINQKFLEALSAERRNPYFKEKVMEYPIITESEINDYLNDKNDSNYSANRIRYILEIIPFIVSLFRSGGKFEYEVSEKFHTISSINESIIGVLRNPGMEELILSTKKQRETNI